MPTLPLLSSLREYRTEWLRYDLTSGLAIAAVGLPSAIAYPALAGLPPEIGLYSSIVSLLGYALLGSSRQLIVGPDAGTVTVLAAVLLSFGLSSTDDRIVASAAIAVIAGLLYFLASFLRLGFIANFLSRPILTGFMTGISLSILVGQIGRFTGVKIESDGLVRPLFEIRSEGQFDSLAIAGIGRRAFHHAPLTRRVAPRHTGPAGCRGAGHCVVGSF